jgi:hypothetical protein
VAFGKKRLLPAQNKLGVIIKRKHLVQLLDQLIGCMSRLFGKIIVYPSSSEIRNFKPLAEDRASITSGSPILLSRFAFLSRFSSHLWCLWLCRVHSLSESAKSRDGG